MGEGVIGEVGGGRGAIDLISAMWKHKMVCLFVRLFICLSVCLHNRVCSVTVILILCDVLFYT